MVPHFQQLMIKRNITALIAQKEKTEVVLSMASASKGLKAREQAWVILPLTSMCSVIRKCSLIRMCSLGVGNPGITVGTWVSWLVHTLVLVFVYVRAHFCTHARMRICLQRARWSVA